VCACVVSVGYDTLIYPSQLAKSYYWRLSVAAGDDGECREFRFVYGFLQPQSGAVSAQAGEQGRTHHEPACRQSQLAAKCKGVVVTDIYPVGYMCRRTISVTLPCQVPISCTILFGSSIPFHSLPIPCYLLHRPLQKKADIGLQGRLSRVGKNLGCVLSTPSSLSPDCAVWTSFATVNIKC
jgi:hypothetical protein